MAKPMRTGYVLFVAAGVASVTCPTAFAQWSGRANETVIYGISKAKSDLQIAGATASNAAITGFLAIDSKTVPQVPFDPDFPGKRIQLLHNEPTDRFELMTDLENINTPRHQNQINSKILTLNGILRDDNPGSVSTSPFDATGGLFVPYFPGLNQGPGRSIELYTSLLWSPSSTTPPYVRVPEGTFGLFGPAGTTGIEIEGLSGVAAFFAPWINMQKYYPSQSWPQGVDIKPLDSDPNVGDTAFLIRLRPGASTPAFYFTANTHLFVVQGSAVVQPLGGDPQPFNLNYYSFAPSGFSLTISNPLPYTGPGATR
jgi:hypothetical protein